MNKLVLSGISVDVLEIQALYLDAATWHTNNFQAVADWFGTETTTTTPPPTTAAPTTTAPTTPAPTQPTDAPSTASMGAILSIGTVIVCLALNL